MDNLPIYAIGGPNWVALEPGKDLVRRMANAEGVFDDIRSSYKTVTIWSPQYRAAQGIKVIVDDVIPPGKQATGWSLVDDEGEPRRVWTLADVTLPTLNDYRSAIQARIDTTAGERGYDSGVTCASYVGSTNSTWAAEAAALVAWRDAVWSYAYAEMARVQAGERGQPAIAAFLAELPSMTWPE